MIYCISIATIACYHKFEGTKMTKMYGFTNPVELPERTRLTSASPSPLLECQNAIVFLLPRKIKVASSGQTLDSCTFCILVQC